MAEGRVERGWWGVVVIVLSYLGGFVFGGGDEIGSVEGPLEIGDCHAVFVDWDIVE